MDAFIAGNSPPPADACPFDKDEAIMVDGSLHRIKRPLDFVAVTDHSKFIGEACSLMNEGAPGVFTTIHAHEWTSAPGGSNQHRNVFFRDANMPDVPFSSN